MESNIKEEIREIIKEFSGEELGLTDEELDVFHDKMLTEYYELLKAELFAEKVCVLIDSFYLRLSNVIMKILNFTVQPFEFAEFDCKVNREIIKNIADTCNELKRCYVLLKRLKAIQKAFRYDLVSLGVIEEIICTLKDKHENLMSYALCMVENLNRQRAEFEYIPGQMVENEGPKYDERIETLLLELKNPNN